ADCSNTAKRDGESWAALPKWHDTPTGIKTEAVLIPALAEQNQYLAVITQRDKFCGLNALALRLAKGILTKKREQSGRKPHRTLASCITVKRVQRFSRQAVLVNETQRLPEMCFQLAGLSRII